MRKKKKTRCWAIRETGEGKLKTLRPIVEKITKGSWEITVRT